ncbi:DUF2332 domain-containing protein [Cellulosimicrobium funkei]|nr:DUF2332 domain-containing protein [Cellulosimicrobium funkei]
MDSAIHRGDLPPSEAYRRFAQIEAHGSSEVHEDWARNIAEDPEVLELVAGLPGPKRQPNLVFAAARLHGAEGSYTSFRSTLMDRWDVIRETILARSTQTNEAARCAVLLPFLAELPQPLALVEVGASAGLCLLPDRYTYRYSDGTRLDPTDGPSEVVIDCRLGPGVQPPQVLPEVIWRAGIDLSPVNTADPEDCTWLETLIWPGHEGRRDRLRSALAIARRESPRIIAGDLNEALPGLAAQAPADATLVVFHTAVLAYLDEAARGGFVDLVSSLPGHWISNEGPGVLSQLRPVPESIPPGKFVIAVDGIPRATADPHGRSVSGLAF